MQNPSGVPKRSPPRVLDGAKVILLTPLDTRHSKTGACQHTVGGDVDPPFSGLVIASYAEADGVYLFYCDASWSVLTDTWHETVDDAKAQAAFEFQGVDDTWVEPPADDAA